jgi:hypothetical protein
MSEKTKRPWFRFHLLTAVLIMLAASGMLWANCDKLEINVPNDKTDYGAEAYGWPCWVFLKRSGTLAGINMDGQWWFASGILTNVAVGLAILAALTLASEFILRRLPARPDPLASPIPTPEPPFPAHCLLRRFQRHGERGRWG